IITVGHPTVPCDDNHKNVGRRTLDLRLPKWHGIDSSKIPVNHYDFSNLASNCHCFIFATSTVGGSATWEPSRPIFDPILADTNGTQTTMPGNAWQRKTTLSAIMPRGHPAPWPRMDHCAMR